MTDDGTHECPYPGCQQRVPFEQLACRRHWYMVPKPLRDALWRAWRSDDMAEHSRVREEIVQFWTTAAV